MATERGATSDDDLLRLLRDGDEGALTTLYRRWQRPLYRFGLRMTGRETLAEDAVQETFLAVVNGAKGYDNARGSFAGWLFGVARHQLLRRLRAERPYLPIENDSADRPAPDDPHADLVERQELSRLRRAILSLPEHYREALVLCGLEGLSYQDAAQALGCAVGTVRSRLNRGREMVATRMQEGERPTASVPGIEYSRGNR
jgi:RNA polymerase sigma-70 factor (ECF subfamily)